MEGGSGNDTYLVGYRGRGGDEVLEGAHGGFDRVLASVDYVLPAGVEALTIAVSFGQLGSGNPLDNVLRGSSGDDTLFGLRGDDRLLGGAGDDLVAGGLGNDVLSGNAGRDVLTGRTGRDLLYGGDNGDTLRGGEGADVLEGEGSRDVIVGGNGRDTLDGGAGADVFRFAQATEVGLGRSSDTILDFGTRDEIDLRGIDADTTTPRRQDAFSFIGDAAFSGTPGELRFAAGVLAGDLDGDGAADFALRVIGTGEPFGFEPLEFG
jgi:Ca2+-binding RTX toxin-like protein